MASSITRATFMWISCSSRVPCDALQAVARTTTRTSTEIAQKQHNWWQRSVIDQSFVEVDFSVESLCLQRVTTITHPVRNLPRTNCSQQKRAMEKPSVLNLCDLADVTCDVLSSTTAARSARDIRSLRTFDYFSFLNCNPWRSKQSECNG